MNEVKANIALVTRVELMNLLSNIGQNQIIDSGVVTMTMISCGWWEVESNSIVHFRPMQKKMN